MKLQEKFRQSFTSVCFPQDMLAKISRFRNNGLKYINKDTRNKQEEKIFRDRFEILLL